MECVLLSITGLIVLAYKISKDNDRYKANGEDELELFLGMFSRFNISSEDQKTIFCILCRYDKFYNQVKNIGIDKENTDDK